jgi:putative RNA 2'-phosphotransferase
MNNIKQKGRFLALILRHKPDVINIKLDEHGWALTQKLIDSDKFTMEILEQIVKQNNKGRFAFNDDKTKIRALQGHSVKVDLGLEEVEPPDKLYHGTSRKFVESIMHYGIQKQSREYVV